MLLVFIISYPLLVHLSVLFDQPRLRALAVVFFMAAILYKSLAAGSKPAWLALLASAVVAAMLGYFGAVLLFVYLPPILLPLMLLIVFSRTLANGREPLVTAIGEGARGPLDPAMRRYTRRVTQAWCVIFAVLVVFASVLPWLDNDHLWSWFTNVFSYALVGAAFLGEFVLRKKLFPHHDHPGLIEYLRIVASADIRP